MDPQFRDGAILAIASAALGFIAARSEGWFERRRARKTLATGLLAELKWLDGLLRQVIRKGPGAFYDPFDHPFTESAIAQLTLFDSALTERIANFHAMLRDVRAGINEYRARPGALGAREEEFKRFLKAKAYFAAKAIPSLRDALLSAGGSLPLPNTETTVDGAALPALPPSSFGKLPQDDE